MMHFVAIGMVLWGLWRCFRCNQYFYVGMQPNLADRRAFKQWKAAQRVKLVTTNDDEALPVEDNVEPQLAWYDRTLLCCCIWPLLWRGRFSNTCTGTAASLYCRVMRVCCCLLLPVLIITLVGAVAKLVVDADPHGRSIVDLWNKRAGRGMSPIRPPPPPFSEL